MPAKIRVVIETWITISQFWHMIHGIPDARSMSHAACT
jgi:hypothetical protein